MNNINPLVLQADMVDGTFEITLHGKDSKLIKIVQYLKPMKYQIVGTPPILSQFRSSRFSRSCSCGKSTKSTGKKRRSKESSSAK
jgi:hypothetical protein